MERTERDALIEALRAQGMSLKEIGDKVGLSGTRVSRILRASNGHKEGTPARASSSNGQALRRHACATPGCGRKLTAEHSIYSSHTGLRYCWPGEGCTIWSREKRRRRRVAEVGEAAAA